MNPEGHRVQIVVAILALVGVLGGAAIANWDKISPNKRTEKSVAPLQVSTGDGSPNISNVQGNVSVSVNPQPKPLDIPDFSGTISTTDQIGEFEKFIDEHRGKLVQVNVEVAGDQSKVWEEGGHGFDLASVACTTPNFLECKTSTLVLKGDDYSLGWYQGTNRLSGYFVIDDNVEMHQGYVFGLKAVDRASILMELQRQK